MYLISQQVKSVATSVKSVGQSVALLQSAPQIVPGVSVPVVAPTAASAEAAEDMTVYAPAGSDVTLVSRCIGKIQSASSQDYLPYCIGKTQLASRRGGTDTVISEATTSDIGHAVFLEQLGPKISSGIVLSDAGSPSSVVFAFGPDGCLTDLDCGPGPAPRSIVDFNVQTKKLRSLPNFPIDGEVVWGPQQKGLFIKITCGGVACNAEPIYLYDLATDQTKAVTTEKAAEISGAKDVNDSKLSYWSELSWDDQLGFGVTYNRTNGTKLYIYFSADGVITSRKEAN